MASGVIVSLGELLVEIMRENNETPLASPGTFRGPYASGAPAIFAWAAARLGAAVRFAGVCGDDPFGTLCREHLQDAGVDLFVRTTPAHETGAAFVSYCEGGDREFLFYLRHAAAAQLSPADVPKKLLEGVGWLHVTGSSLGVSEGMRQAVFTAVERARAQGATVSFDPNVRPELFPGQTLADVCRPILDAADVILPSFAEAEQLTGMSDPEAACRALLTPTRIVVLKRGAEGCTLYTDAGEQHLPGLPVREVDPTGAGDAFAAGFAVASLRGEPPPQAARFANIVGALSVTAFGPTSAPLSHERVKSLL